MRVVFCSSNANSEHVREYQTQKLLLRIFESIKTILTSLNQYRVNSIQIELFGLFLNNKRLNPFVCSNVTEFVPDSIKNS